MSEFSIKDGAGSGLAARVDSANRLLTAAVTQTISSTASAVDGSAFSLPILNYTLPSAGTSYLLLWYKNLDPARNFHVNRYYMSWNGGDTTYIRCLDVRLYIGTYEPSANYVAFPPGNLNLTSPQLALADARLWNTVGDGMTTAALGIKGQALYLAKGPSIYDIDGTFIIGYGQSIGVVGIPEEAGKTSLIMTGWYQED